MYAEISVIPSTVHIPGYSVLGHMRRRKSESVFLSVQKYALQKTHIQQLDHVYMESGHSQMECDSAHAAIESAVRNMDVYAPTDYYRAVSMARRSNPYHVVMMNQSDFMNFRPLAKHLIRNYNNNAEVSWLKVKHFQYRKANPNCIYFKYDSNIDNDNFTGRASKTARFYGS